VQGSDTRYGSGRWHRAFTERDEEFEENCGSISPTFRGVWQYITARVAKLLKASTEYFKKKSFCV
jgi:hypothetical protein